MLQQTDIEGRLRLFRYGLVVVVVVTFLVSLLAPYVITSAYATELNKVAAAVDSAGIDISIGTFLGQAFIATIVVGVLMGVVYFVYRSMLAKSQSAAA